MHQERGFVRRTTRTRVLALSLGMLAITQNALSAPGDIFVMPAPAIGSPAPKGADIKVGEASVATQTGALQWAYPIAVPPGRHGAVPTLSIAYTSQGSIYGTLAAGFTLAGVPEIREDTSLGRLRTRSDTDKANDRFTSSLAGNMRLVKVSLPAASDVYGVYRAQGDTTAAQYERMIQAQAYYWRVRHTDGSEMYFGEATHGCSNLMRESYAPLTTFRDVFGNEVSYEYEEGAPYECRLKRITWGQNANAGLNQPFAKVELAYSGAVSCGPPGGGGGPSIWVGAQLDFRTGKRIVTGASKLLQITATAFEFGGEATPSHTRVITLDYFEDKESCATSHSPVRLLRSIQESAWGTAAPRVDLPPITFTYGTPAIALTGENTIPFAKLWSGESLPFNFGWGRRAPASAQDKWPSVEAMMIDMNGDGLPDRLANASIPEGDGQCKARWARNEGPSAPALMFSVAGQITLPRLRWRGSGTPVATGAPSADAQSTHFESCALNGQATAYRNVINGSQVNCHPGSVPDYSETQFLPFVQFCYGPGEFGLEHPTAAGVDGEFRTYLGYRWMDVTGDGLTDLVAAVQGNITGYDIVIGNDPFFTSDTAPFGAWPTCPQIDRCKKLDADCLDHAVDQASMDICIANAPSAPCGDLTTTVYSMPGKPISPPAPERTPYQRCEGLYPWFIYENQGNGTFLPMPRIIYSPVELESSTGDSPAFAPFVVSKDHAIMDIDGDGIIDAAKLDEDGKNWQIWLGDGTGAFEPHRYVFSRLPRPSYQFFAMNSTSYYGQASSNGEGLIDLNGDGLPEHWSVNPSGANVAFHDGTGFEVSPIDAYGKCYGPCSGAMQLPILPGDATGYSNLIHDPNGRIIGGSSVATKRVVDVDADGRVDVVDLVPTPAQVYFNLGGQLRSSTASYPGNSLGLQRKVDAYPEDQDNTWEVTAELIDLNGDGIMESASFATGGLEQHEHVYGASPPRLLKRIENGRGAVTVVSYSSMHDKNAVEQHPDQYWPDGRPMASPNNQWVVRALATHDSLSSTTSTTSHFYKNPRHGKNDEGRYSFRGFEEVEVTAPSGAKTVSRYDYQVDWSGRLVETRVHPAEALGDVRSIDRTEWIGRQSFGGAITTYHATLRKQYTCKNAQAIEACLNEPAGATYTVIAQTPFDVGGPTILWQDTETTLQAGLTVADGDRRTWSKYTLVRDATHYRFRQIDTTREQRVNGSWVMFGKSASSWDSDFKVQLTNEVWVDADDSHTAITRFVYDMATGNVLQRFKPVQNAESGPAAGYTYDSRKLFVVTETNELGHVRDLEYEYGTGTKLSTSGPNPAYCPGNCPPGMTCMPKERHAIVVDGLGREIQQWDTTGGPCTFPYVQRTETTYFDGTSSSAGWTRHRRRIDVNQSTWTDEKTELDGHGRPTKKTVFVQGSAPADQITTFTYENDGTLSRVEVPDPSVNTVARVAYTYTYDSLGRATSVRRPDATADIDKSGVDISYDGLTQTTSEVVGAAGGNPAVTKIVKDRFGRLVEVHEQLTPSPATWATTLYAYGPDDNVRTVTDPEAVTTELEHDFAGRRTAITRSGRTWKYTYDRNGNMKSELVPGADDLLDEINFKTFIDYDALDRPISKLVGQRHLSAPDQAAFGGNTESFLWDYGGNMIGYLRRWQSFAPNNPTPLLKVDAFVDSLGLQESTTQVFNVAGYSNLQRKFFQNYNVMGAVKQAWYYDEFTYSDCNSADCTNAVFVYDARGLPSQIQLSDSAGPVKTIGNQTRNVAGLVTKRRTTPPPGGPMTYVESNWTYDQLGRVIGQVVQKAPAPVSIARQDLAYLGNDDPSSLTQWLGSSSQELGFTFDHRHQLTNVASSTPGYFSATYDFGPAGRFTHAGEQTLSPQPTGSDVMPREVTYVYGGQDPEQVTQLVNVTDGNTYASFTYDAAGNQQSRCLGAVVTPSCSGESLEYIYDGKDQLRRVTKKLGGVVQGSEEYWYDSFGSRIAIVSRDAGANRTELVTFTNGTESHYNPGGSLSYAYSHVSFGTPVARVKRSAAMITSVEYQFHGLANSTLAAVAADGTINASFSYAPFGSVVESTNNGGVSGNGVDAHKRRHNDKFIDTISGLSHYGARYYDKTLLGWTQSDPRYHLSPDLQKSSPRKANLYSFSLQNPLRYLDPDGKDPQNSQAYMIRVRDAVEDGSYEPMKELVRTAAVKTTMGGGKLRALADILRMSVGVNDYRGNEISKDPRGASNLIMVDLNSEDSRKTAEAIGGPFAKANVESLLNHKEYFASATIGGNTIVLSLDRLKDAIERLAIKDPTWNADTKSGRERILEYLDERIAHEVGHNFGLGRGNDDDDDVMKERRTLSDSLMSKRASWSGRDIGGVSDRLDAYRAPRAD